MTGAEQAIDVGVNRGSLCPWTRGYLHGVDIISYSGLLILIREETGYNIVVVTPLNVDYIISSI